MWLTCCWQAKRLCSVHDTLPWEPNWTDEAREASEEEELGISQIERRKVCKHFATTCTELQRFMVCLGGGRHVEVKHGPTSGLGGQGWSLYQTFVHAVRRRLAGPIGE